MLLSPWQQYRPHRISRHIAEPTRLDVLAHSCQVLSCGRQVKVEDVLLDFCPNARLWYRSDRMPRSDCINNMSLYTTARLNSEIWLANNTALIFCISGSDGRAAKNHHLKHTIEPTRLLEPLAFQGKGAGPEGFSSSWGRSSFMSWENAKKMSKNEKITKRVTVQLFHMTTSFDTIF